MCSRQAAHLAVLTAKSASCPLPLATTPAACSTYPHTRTHARTHARVPENDHKVSRSRPDQCCLITYLCSIRPRSLRKTPLPRPMPLAMRAREEMVRANLDRQVSIIMSCQAEQVTNIRTFLDSARCSLRGLGGYGCPRLSSEQAEQPYWHALHHFYPRISELPCSKTRRAAPCRLCVSRVCARANFLRGHAHA